MASQDDSVVEDQADETTWTAERLCRASYKDLGTPPQVEERFLRHLLSSPSCRSSLQVLLTSQSTTTRDYSLEIDTFDLLHSDVVLGSLLLRFPATLLPLLENAIVRAQRHLKESSNSVDNDDAFVKGDKSNGQTMTRVHARLVHLPPSCCKVSLGSLLSTDVGKILQVSGTVVRASPVQMYESARTYKCTGKNGCGRTFVEYADLEQRHNALVTPANCPLLTETGERCKGTKLEVVPNGSIHTDYQEIKIQEAASRIGVGHIPRSLLIKLQHDLVDKTQPGDEVVVVGSLLAQWQSSVSANVDCNVGMALKAHSIRVLQEKGASSWNSPDADGNSSNNVGELDKMRKEFDLFWENSANKAKPIAARDFICKAVCPKLYGMSMVKLALLVTLIGGVSADAYQDNDDEQENENAAAGTESRSTSAGNEIADRSDDDEPVPFRIAQDQSARSEVTYNYGDERNTPKQRKRKDNGSVHTRRRDQSHMLLVGDPGTGKSQFLRFAAAICPRSVLTTGVGTTSAGLTCAAVREGDGKEFVLEAGALVLADKGVCCIDEFGCIRDQDRTTIHEAMEQQTLSVAKAGIVCKLNCRATIIAVMNPKDSLYDNHASLSRNTGLGTPLLSRFDIIFKLVDSSDAQRDSNITTYLLNRAIQGAGFDTSGSDEDDSHAPWNMEKLRAYISVVKDRFNPVISEDAAMLLEGHYEKIRMSPSSTIPITVRFLESLIRLSQAHARLMYRSIVTLQDAVAVVRIMECSAFAYGGFDGNVDDVENILFCDPMTMEFTSTPDLEFLCFEYKVLERYGMLDRLSNEQRREALAYMGGTGGGGTASEWGEVESLRDRQPPQYYNNSVCQDHYGRIHFSTQGQGGFDSTSLQPNHGNVPTTQSDTRTWDEHNKRRRM